MLRRTANEFARSRTNVVKLFFTLARDPHRQVAYYHPGLGTMEPLGTLTQSTRTVTRVLGTAFGYGLAADSRTEESLTCTAPSSPDMSTRWSWETMAASRGKYVTRFRFRRLPSNLVSRRPTGPQSRRTLSRVFRQLPRS